MTAYHLDANVLRHLAHADPGSENIAARLARYRKRIALSAIVRYELEAAAANVRLTRTERAALADLLGAFPVIAFDAAAAQAAAKVRAATRAKPIGPLDTLIAGQALAAGAVLVSDNAKEFGRVPGLDVENWLRA